MLIKAKDLIAHLHLFSVHNPMDQFRAVDLEDMGTVLFKKVSKQTTDSGWLCISCLIN